MDPEHKISVNFATPSELRIIPGVGDKMAEAIVEMRLRNSNVTASFLSSILRKRLPEDVLACLDFRPNPNFAATDEQQDDGYGAVSLDYEDGYKAQLTEEIKREIENRLWPESSTIPKERGTVGGPEASSVPLTMSGAVRGPEAFFVPWTKPVYKMTTSMQEDPIHQDTVFPKQKTKKHKDDKSQSTKVRRKLNLEECSDESEGAEKKHRSTKLETEHKSTKQKISAEDGKRKHSNKLKLSKKSDKFSDKDKYSLKEKKKQKKSAVRSKKHRHETSSSSSSEDSGSDSDVVKKKSQMKSVLHTLPKQLQYDGKSNWLHFKHKFIKYAKSSDWTAEECLDCLSWCLTGKAADFCATLMERKRHLSYRKLMKRLDDRFSDRELPASAQVRFQQAAQKKEESLEDWADRVLTLSGKAFKELPEKYSNQQAVTRFCQGLNGAEAGLYVCMRKPSRMGDALNEIKLYQHTKDAIYGHRKERTVSSRVTAEDLEDVAAWYDDLYLADKVVNQCLQKYNQLPKKGKPQKDVEWTLLAGILVAIESEDPEEDYLLRVVSLGTGSKCIGQSKMSKEGNILNDSHAEILARRAFICFLYHELCQVYKGQRSEIFTFPTARFGRKVKVRDKVSFHFYSSHTPCGDASIFPKHDPKSMANGEHFSNTDVSPVGVKRKLETIQEEHEDEIIKRIKEESSVESSTPLENSNSLTKADFLETDISLHDDMHVVNSSCSDKIMDTDITTDCGKENKTLPSVAIDKNSDTTADCNDENNTLLSEKNCDTITDCAEKIKTLPSDENTNISTNKDIETTGTLSNDKNVCSDEDHRMIDEDENQKDHSVQNNKQIVELGTVVSDIYRTGAKCVPEGIQDPLGKGEDYHTVGAFRTKPGRGERTLSMACSDKLSKWNLLGCQGALLMHFIEEPIYFETITTGRCPYNEQAMRRAIVERSEELRFQQSKPYPMNLNIDKPVYRVKYPKFYQSSIPFEDGREEILKKNSKSVPSPAAIGWCSIGSKSCVHDVTVSGRKQGVTAKLQDKPLAWSKLCPRELFKLFISLKESVSSGKLPASLSDPGLKTYKDFKMAASDYQFAKQQMLEAFGSWVHKPDGFLDFTVAAD